MSSLSSSSVSSSTTVDDATPSQVWVVRRRLFWGILLLLLLLALYKVGRVGLAGQRSYLALSTLRETARAGLTIEQLPSLRPQFAELAAALEGLDRELRIVYPLLVRVNWLPTYGPTLRAAPHLLYTAKELTALASEGLALVEPAFAAPDNNQRLQQALALLAEARPELEEMAARADVANQALAVIPATAMHPAIADNVAQLQQVLPLAGEGLRIAPDLPRLLGFAGVPTYLVLVQNNHELRATGGFISAVGRVTLQHAEPMVFDFVDSYTYYNDALSYPPAPAPMQRYMGIPLLLLRDANWSPDLPTSASLVQALYAQETDGVIDGVVTVDLHAVERLIDALGPLILEGADELITGKNVVEQIKQLWTTPEESGGTIAEVGLGKWWGGRKDFIPKLANSALQLVQSGELDYLRLVEAGLTTLNQRSIQIWIDKPAVASALARLGWDGGIHPTPDADFLAWVDTNMGYNKVDAVIKRALDYRVEWPAPDQPALATASMTYTHPLTVTDELCQPVSRYGVTYDDLIARCYFSYLRVYTPAGSQLVKMSGVEGDSISTLRGENNTQIFTGYFHVRPGAQHVVTVEYALPPTLIPAAYALTIQRQSGTMGLPVTLHVQEQTLSTTLVNGRWEWSVSRKNQ
jgi:hypothetical protein